MIFLVFFLIPTLVFADWDCSKNLKVKKVQQWMIVSDATEAKLEAERVNGKMEAVEDASGKIAYLIKYEANVVSDDLFSGNLDCTQNN